jgi:4-hydroxy-L-threonine phosphate dehydrogenase PdxA
MATGRDDFSIFNQSNPIGQRNGRESMSHDQRRSVLKQGFKRAVDLLFDMDINRTRCVIENQDRGIDQ